jgi:hypothetical protein
MNTKVSPTSRHVRSLVQLLEELCAGHGDLLNLIERKSDSMKRADIETMSRLVDREQELVKFINERNGLRRQLMEAIGSQIGVSPRKARLMTASQLAARLPEAEGRCIRGAAEKLGNAMARVSKANRMAAVISRGILAHLKAVFAAVATPENRKAGYTDAGGAVSANDPLLFEAVG